MLIEEELHLFCFGKIIGFVDHIFLCIGDQEKGQSDSELRETWIIPVFLEL